LTTTSNLLETRVLVPSASTICYCCAETTQASYWFENGSTL